MSWVDNVSAKARLLHDQIAGMRGWATKAGASADQLEAILAPYYELLDELYQDEYPFAQALDSSDLVIRAEGPAVEADAPRLSAVTGLFTNLRHEVHRISKALAGLAQQQGRRLIGDVDLGLSAVARGSLIIGVRVKPPSGGAKPGENHTLLAEDDLLYQSIRKAVQQLAIVTRHLDEEGVQDSLADDIPDPGVRDAVLVAAQRLSPSGRRGIDSVSLFSAAAARSSEVEPPRPLTKQTKRVLRSSLLHPVKGSERGRYEGVVRQIDLDARRFEVRHVRGVGAIRCVYGEALSESASEWLNRRVRITGNVEKARDGLPRLMELDALEILEEVPIPENPDLF